ncbi:MAG: RHS repeat-associated core domain-containing protein [Phycisphaerae bacterium]
MTIKASGSTIDVWDGNTKVINGAIDSTIDAGGFALGGDQPKFRNIKIGYDNNGDNDIDDAGDDIVYADSFDSTSFSLNADHSDATADDWDKNGNLLDDGWYLHTYDAWNRLVKIKTQEDNLTIAEYGYDGLGRRIKKVVTSRQPLDGTTYYYYNKKWQMLESRDGSENVDTQVIYGTRYVDEIVRFEHNGKGAMFAFQNANWNVTSTVNYDTVVLDRLHTSPYGEPTWDTETINGDYDGDGDLDGTDDSNLTTCKNGTQPVTGACRVFDFDNDGDVDTADETVFDSIYSGSGADIMRQPGRRTSANAFPFAHQGLMLDEETLTYQNRFRQYNPWQKRFLQQDPAGQKTGLNTYAYTGSRPTSSLDPTGLDDDFRVEYQCGTLPPGFSGWVPNWSNDIDLGFLFGDGPWALVDYWFDIGPRQFDHLWFSSSDPFSDWIHSELAIFKLELQIRNEFYNTGRMHAGQLSCGTGRQRCWYGATSAPWGFDLDWIFFNNIHIAYNAECSFKKRCYDRTVGRCPPRHQHCKETSWTCNINLMVYDHWHIGFPGTAFWWYASLPDLAVSGWKLDCS